MKLIKYSDAPAEIKARLVKLTKNTGDYSDEYTNAINAAISLAGRSKQYAKKYEGFVYYIDNPSRKYKKRILFFDYLGCERAEAKREWIIVQIHLAYLEFCETNNFDESVLPKELVEAGYFDSYMGAKNAMDWGRFEREDVRAYVLNWLKERGIEVKF